MYSTSVWLVCPETHELWFYTTIMSCQLAPVPRLHKLVTCPSHRTCISMVHTQTQMMGRPDHTHHVHGPADHKSCPLAIIFLNLGIFSPLRHKLVFLRSPALPACLLALRCWCLVSTEWNTVSISFPCSVFACTVSFRKFPILLMFLLFCHSITALRPDVFQFLRDYLRLLMSDYILISLLQRLWLTYRADWLAGPSPDSVCYFLVLCCTPCCIPRCFHDHNRYTGTLL